MKFKLLSLLMLVSTHSPAFTVDSMIKFSNEEDYFLVTGNDDKQREFINITLSEWISHSTHQSHEINYTAENTAQWPIIAEPTEIIVDSDEQVKVKIAKNYTQSDDDRVFGITFTPDTLSHNQEKSYALTFGYKTWYIIPGSQPMKGYLDVTKQKKVGDYIIHNQTNKVMVVKLDYCHKTTDNNENCLAEFIAAPYTNKAISLGEMAMHIEAKFYIGGNDNKDPVKTVNI